VRGFRKALTGLAVTALLGGVLWLRFRPEARALIGDFLAPFLRAADRAEWRVGNASLFLRSKTELIEEIERQRAACAALQAQLDRQQAVVRENNELRARLTVREQLPWAAVTARVLSRDPAAGYQRLRLDRGTASGIAVGQGVLANNALLGRVVETSRHSCLVLCLTDPSCRVSVRLAQPPAEGILEGNAEARWRTVPYVSLRYLPRDQEYEPGTRVETSPYSQVIPAGLEVGVIEAPAGREPVSAVANLYKEATVRPSAWAGDFTFVTVLVQSDSAEPLMGEY
jgi:rod shape-determining protein MreC